MAARTMVVLLLAFLAGCVGDIMDPTGTGPGMAHGPGMVPGGVLPADPGEAPLRRLTRRELENTVTALMGRPVSGALDTIPGDSDELVYDRMGAAQTVSPLHVEGFFALGDAVFAEALADEALLGRILPGCDLAAIGPRARPTRTTTVGSSLAPPADEWRVCYAGDDWSGTNRCPEVTDPMEVKLHFDGSFVRGNHSVATTGRHRLEVVASATGSGTSELVIAVDGVDAGRITMTFSGDPRRYDTYTLDLDLAAGDHEIVYTRASPDAGIYLQSVALYGPVDGATPDLAAQDACVDAFVRGFAPRAWRRPLAAADETAVRTVFTSGAADGFWLDGLRMALGFVLQAPDFLYHVEIGAPTAEPGLHRLDDHEVASRLSYLAWESPPDDELWAAAGRGELRTPEQVRAQAERLFSDPRARTTIRNFYEQWLSLDELESLTKDVAIFPEFTATVRAAMRDETRAFMDAMIWDERATLGSMLIEPRTWLPPDLAGIYGMPAPAALEPVALPEGRIGLLTQPSLLAINSKPTGHSPVRRGVFILERILCEELPPPPPDVDFAAPERSTASTTRDRFGEHTSNPACSGCHRNIDPIGFTLEGFDGIGRSQTEENGVAIDSSGGIPALEVPNGSIDGARELAEALAASDAPDRCLTRQWLRFALGRHERATDATSLETIHTALEGGGVRQMLVDSTATDAFLHRTHSVEEGP